MSTSKETEKSKYIICKVDKVVFHDAKTGRTIMSAIKNDGKPCRVLGSIKKVDVNNILKVVGSWHKDEKYGWQFEADFIQVVSADAMDDESEYLECKVLDVKVLREETGFAFLRGETTEGNYAKISGRLAKVRKGSAIAVLGRWKHDDKYGDEFQASLWEYKSADEETSLQHAIDFIKRLKNGTIEQFVPESPEAPTETAPEVDESLFRLDPDIQKRLEIQTVSISEDIKTIEKETFLGCYNLTEINVAEGNDNYASLDGVLFNKDFTELICYPNGKIGEYIIPDTVKTIADWAFCGCNELSRVEIPKSVTSIGDYSFAYCSSLTHVEIPRATERVGQRAFYCCFRLDSIVVNHKDFNLNDALEGCGKDIIEIKSIVTWDKITIEHECLWLPGFFDDKVVIIPVEEARYYMNDILHRLSEPMPALEVRYKKGASSKVDNLHVIHDVISILKDNRNVDTIYVDWANVSIETGKFVISLPLYPALTVSHVGARPFMNKIVKRISSSLPNFKVLFVEGSEPELANKEIVDDVMIKIRANIITKEVEVAWKDVSFLDGGIEVKDPDNEAVVIHYQDARSSMNKMRKRFSAVLPPLVVRFEEGTAPVIVNKDVLDSIVIILKQNKDYGALIRDGLKGRDLLGAIRVIGKKNTRVFVPRDMTPYLDFLTEKHEIEKYPIVPIQEFIGNTYEECALFTIIKDGQPNIVWENYKDSRSTYIFRCTEENYESRRQVIVDYIMTQESNKRQFLHSNECEKIFGEKPQMIVHNTLESWSARLMKIDKRELKEWTPQEALGVSQAHSGYIHIDSEDGFPLTQAEYMHLLGAVIKVRYEIDQEDYFYDDEMWPEDGSPRALYDNGMKSLYAEVTYKIHDKTIESVDFAVCTDDYEFSDDRDFDQSCDFAIDIVRTSVFDSINSLYARLCQEIIDSMDIYSGYKIEIIIGRKIVYSE